MKIMLPIGESADYNFLLVPSCSVLAFGGVKKVSRLVFPSLNTNTIQVYKSFTCESFYHPGKKIKMKQNFTLFILMWQILESLAEFVVQYDSVVDGLFLCFFFFCLRGM